MNIKQIEEKIKKVEKNTRENLSLIREIIDLMYNEGSTDQTKFNESDFNVPGLLEGLANSRGDQSADGKIKHT